MRKCEDILFEVEEIRKEVTNTWGKLLCQSGAIVLKKPSVLSRHQEMLALELIKLSNLNVSLLLSKFVQVLEVLVICQISNLQKIV